MRLTAIPVPPITFEQYEQFESPDGYRGELINGRIFVYPEAKPLHSQVAENIRELETWVVDPKKEEVKLHRRGQPSRTVSLKQKSPNLLWCAKPIPLTKIFELP